MFQEGFLPTIRILLVDDNTQFLAALARFLKGDPRIRVVGRVNSGTAVLQRVAEVSPDLVLLNLLMPGLNGLEVTRQLKSLPNPPRVLILTMYDLPQYRTAAKSAGADGFVSKLQFRTQLRPSIRALFKSCSNEDDR